MVALFDNVFKSLATRSGNLPSGRSVGVDIGGTAIKVVELENLDGVITLTTYGEIQIGPYADKAIGQAVELEVDREQAAVIDLIRESAVKATEAVYTVPLATSFVTVVDMPRIEGVEDVTSQVRVEARKYIPLPINEVSLDWAEINRPGKKNDDTTEVLLAAIQNETLDRLHNLMQKTNMPKQPTEIECFSLLRSVTGAQDSGVAVLDLGGSSSKLYIAQNGLLEQIHRVRVGGARATQDIAEALNVTFAEAEVKKRKTDPGSQIGRTIKKTHYTTYERVIKEFARVIKQYEKTHERSIDKVLLTGGVSLFNGIADAFMDGLKRDIEFAQPFSRVSYPAFMEDVIEEIAPTFSVALGAALQKFDR
jgi:type IV pilus assembly protein PilM